MLTGLAVFAMLILGTLLWLRKITKISEMLERMLDDQGDEGLAEQLHARPTMPRHAHE